MSEDTATSNNAAEVKKTVKKTVFITRPKLGGTPSAKAQAEAKAEAEAKALAEAQAKAAETKIAEAKKVVANKAAKSKAKAQAHGGDGCCGPSTPHVDEKTLSEMTLVEQQELFTLGRWLCSKDSKVRSLEATLYGERRGYIFQGSELFGAVLSANPKKTPAVAKFYNKSGLELATYFKKMQLLGFFTPVEVLPPKINSSSLKNAKALSYEDSIELLFGTQSTDPRDKENIKVRKVEVDSDSDSDSDEEEEEGASNKVTDKKESSSAATCGSGEVDISKVFSENQIYMWNIEPNSKALLFQSLAVVAFIIAICCMKVWPIWLRIIVYYLSLSLLILLVSTSVLHIISSPIFFVIGFRKTYFLPNLFDDELDMIDTFTPIVGKGGEHQARWKAEREAARRKALGLPQEQEQPSQTLSWQIGFLNIALLLILGVFVASYMGVFSPDNIPDFVVSSQDFFSYFPSLATPEMASKASEFAE